MEAKTEWFFLAKFASDALSITTLTCIGSWRAGMHRPQDVEDLVQEVYIRC